MLCAILAAGGILCVAYQKQVRDRVHDRTFANSKWTRGTPTPAPRPKAPEMSLTQAVTIKTPDGELTIPKGARVRVIEKSTPGTVAVNYQGYTAPVPADALATIPK